MNIHLIGTQVKIWHIKNLGSKKWPAEATLKLRDAVTAVAFASADSDQRYAHHQFVHSAVILIVCRRRLAVGLESGEIVIYSNPLSAPSEWKEELFIDSRYVPCQSQSSSVDYGAHLYHRHAHVDHIHRLSWRPGTNGMTKQLASCSEDGTVKVLLVHIGTV